MADRDVVIRIKASNLTKAEFDKARKQLNDLEKSAGRAGKQGMSPLGKEVRRVGENFASMNPATATASRLLGGTSLVALGAAGAMAGLGVALAAGVRETVRLGEEMTTLRDKTGLSTDFLQEMKFVSDQVGVGFNSVTDAAVRLGRRTAAGLPEATKAIRLLGLNVQSLIAMSPEEQFRTVVQSLSGIENQSERAAAAMAIFGDAGLQLLPLLKNDLGELEREFEAVGGAIESETLVAGRELSDALTSLKQAFHVVMVEGSAPFIDDLKDLAKGAVDAAKSFREFATEQERLHRIAVETSKLQVSPVGLSFEEARKLATKIVDESIAAEEAARESARRSESEATAAAVGFADAQDAEQAAKDLEKYRKKLDELTSGYRIGQRQAELYWMSVKADALEFKTILDEFEFSKTVPGLEQSFGGLPGGLFTDGMEEGIAAAVDGVGDLEEQTRRVEEAQKDYNEALAAANDLAQLIGGSVGQLVGQTFAAGAALQNLSKLGGGSILGGLGGAFSAGKGDATGVLGFLGGVGGLAGAAGPLIGLGTTLFQGLAGLFAKPPDLVRDAARDLGATISQEMADGILASGKPLQLAVAEVFRSGGFESADKFAEEIGDIFSGFSRGEFSKGEALGALQESIPLLIQNFDELGEQGQAQVQRIISAAKEMGFEFDALGDLIQETITEDTLAEMGLVGEMSVHRIRDAARELGVDFEFLFEKVQDTFAPSTLEDFAKEFGITTHHARELAAELGINMQTNLERMAASVGLTADEFLELEKAIEGSFFDKRDLTKEEILKFMEATGLSAKDLADTLGVEVADGAGAVQDEQDKANEKIREGRDFARELRDALREAASAAGGIGGGLAGLRDLLENNTGGLQDAIG